jgi:hypothetical protein
MQGETDILAPSVSMILRQQECKTFSVDELEVLAQKVVPVFPGGLIQRVVGLIKFDLFRT